MRLAQQLYEGVEVKGKGTLGLITYLRTDSTRIADEADTAARSFVKEHYGEKYVAQGSQAKKEGVKIQDAHEAIRPTDITLTPTIVKRITAKRPVPALPVNLEAVYSQPYGAGCI